MNICILTTIYPLHEGDFSGIFVHRLAKGLLDRGMRVHVVAPCSRTSSIKDETIEGIHIHRFQYMFPPRLQTLAYHPGIPENIRKNRNKLQVMPFALSMTLRMLQVARRYDIDLINAHWALPSGLIATLTKPFHGRPVVTTLYGAELFLAKHKYAMLQPALRRAIVRSDKVVAISDATADAAISFTTLKQVEIIPDGVDTQYFSPTSDGTAIRQRHHLEANTIILSCGRLVERKGFEYLIRAIPAISERCPNAVVVIIGEGPERSRLVTLSSSLGVQDRVLFAGRASHEDLPKYYAACDLFVLPSVVDSRGDTEGSGTTVVEAMATGKAVIATNVGGIPYALRDGETGFLVQPAHPDQIAERVLLLLADAGMRKSFAEKALRVAKERFDWQSISQQYAGLFADCVPPKQGVRGAQSFL